ncbi:MAG: hypothetical protein KatS3mg068_0530 [Candidatus Sericytochromatia bacterium]|nr:MAG: hypothetical protein KatS3mg068_0530 [Candidatus Sericytochromatia bacterium]
MIRKKFLTLIFLLITSNALAKQSVETTPWGYSGIINVPNSNVIEKGKFYINSAYTVNKPNFLSSFQIGLIDNLEIGILGGLPSDIYSGLAGNIKYQILKQNKELPLSFAMGINLLGIKKVGNNNNFFNLGNAIYMIASYDLNINLFNNQYNLLSTHLGFSGNLEATNLLAAIDIPITKFVNLGLEYTSKTNISNEMINFGIKIKPINELSINFFSLGNNFSQGFKDAQYMIGLFYNSNLLLNSNSNISQKNEEKKEETKISNQINKEESKLQKQNNQENEKTTTNKEENKNLIKEGTLKIMVTDENDNSNLSNVQLVLENKENNIYNKYDIINGVYTIDNLKYGSYKLTFNKENYEALVYTTKLDSNLNNISVKMKKISSSIFAKVFNNVSIPYPDLDIVLDETIKTKTDKEGKFSFINITPGKHIIKIIKNDELLKKIDIDVLKGIDLKREIYLDEVKTGNSKSENKNTSKTELKSDLKENKKQENKDKEKELIVSKNTENNNLQNTKKEDKKTNNSLIVGKVTSEGQIIQSARIVLEGDKVTIMTISNKEGFYLIKNIPPGQYKITASKKGFLDKSSKINLEANNQYKFDIILGKKTN